MSLSNEDDLIRVVPELLQFNNEGNAIHNWLAAFGQIDASLIYAKLFWPDFQSLYGSVFLRPIDEVLYEAWMTKLNRDTQKVQRTLNHTHLADFFCNSEPRVTTEKLLTLGRLLTETWKQKLKLDFPDQKFEVALAGGTSPDPVDVTITFNQIGD